MNDQRKKNPVRNVGILIVVAVSIVIGTILYNAISEKRAYDEAHPAEATSASTAH
ncbi:MULTISPECIES: hypothetical protein [unclassified Burkholderia]|uniref:hypothetical protein n=1 Tax=unclassified Burkholderia TaxID=2613784 RepID=UPI001639CC0A|nr:MULTISPECIES: hypothetical protein [unclassified Burkholderia]